MQVNFGGLGGGMFFDTVDYVLKVWIGNALAQNQSFSTIPQIAQQQFQEIIVDLARNPAPMKAEMSRPTDAELTIIDGNYHYDALVFTNKAWDRSRKEAEENEDN